jgi:hypothetical protein
MNRSRTKQLALFTTAVLLIVCFVPSVQGWAGYSCRINVRPIEDWLEAGNPFGSGPGFLDPDSMLSQRLLSDVYGAESYRGFIIETLMGDGSLLYYLYIEVKNVPVAIRDWNIGEWIFVGYVDYTYRAVFILDKEIPGGDLLDWDFGDLVPDENGDLQPLIVPFAHIPEGQPDREMGADLPAWWILYWYQHEVGGHFVYLHFKSDGSGNFIEAGWNPGPDPPVMLGEGNVEVNQQAFYSDHFDVNDPDVYQFTSWSVPEGVLIEGGPVVQSPLLMPETWPLEYVRFY